MINFYETLLTINAAVFGIFVAVIFVYAEIISNRFPLSLTRLLVRDRKFFFFVGVLGLSTLLSGAGLYYLSNFYPTIIPASSRMMELVKSDVYAAASLASLLTAVGYFIYLLYYYTRYLRLDTVIPLLVERVVFREIADYTAFHYGIPEPSVYDITVGPKATLEEGLEKAGEELEEAKKRYQKRMAVLKTKEDRKAMYDPLTPLFELGSKALAEHDRKSWQLINSVLIKANKRWLAGGEIPTKDFDGTWDFNRYTALNYAKLLVEHFAFLSETAEEIGHSSLIPDLIRTTKTICLDFMDREGWEGPAPEFFKFWENEGRKALDRNHTSSFVEAVGSIEEAGLEIIKQEHVEARTRGEILNGLHLTIARLGELVAAEEVKKTPSLIPHREALDEMGSIASALLRSSDSLEEKELPFYPLILFDAVEIIVRKLIECGTEEATNEKTIVSLLGIIADLTRKGATLQREEVVWIGTMRLGKLYETANLSRFKEAPQDIAIWLAETGALCAIHNKKVEDLYVPSGDMVNLVMRELPKITNPDHLAEAMHEADTVTMGKGNHGAVWDYIVRVGKEFGTNFGFMFDPTIGKTYPEDHPLRKRR